MNAKKQLSKLYIVGVFLIVGGFLALLFSVFTLWAQPAAAAERLVTTTADSGPGSLRQVLADAQAGDTITFDLTYPAEILLSQTEEILIDKNLTITGPGADLLTIKTSNYEGIGARIFKIAAGTVVTISDLTFANAGGYGTLARQGGAIYNAGSLTLIRCTFTNNASQEGGAIYNEGTLTLSHSLVSNNVGGEAYHDGDVYGAGVYNSMNGTGVIEYTTIDGNGPDQWFDPGGEYELFGGGIYNLGALEVRYSTIEYNQGYEGAGIYNQVNSVLTLTHSTVANNYAQLEIVDPDTWDTTYEGYGGGIHNSGQLTALNSTLYANSAYQDGGGIHNWWGASLSLEHVTIGNNYAGSRGNGEGGGLWADGAVSLKNSVLAENSADQNPDCASGGAAFISEDYNLVETLGNCAISNAGNDRLDWAITLFFHRFAANGGPTDTYAPYTNSILVNSIPITNCTTITDQRGVPRPQNNPNDIEACDIGAYETATMGWDGDGGDGSWLNDTNWTWDVRPGMGDVAHLGSTTPVTVTYDETQETTSVGFINLTGSGVTLQQAGYVRLEHNYTQSAGTFNGDPTDEMALGTFSLSGGLFHAPGEMRLSGNFLHNGGVFEANGGELVFMFSPTQTISGDNIFYDLTIGKWAVDSTVDASSSTLIVTNQLTVTKGIFRSASSYHHVQIEVEGTLELSGDITVSGDWINNGAVITNGHIISFTGTGPQILQETRVVSGTGTVRFLDDGRGGGVLVDANGQGLGQVTVTERLNADCTTEAGEVFGRCFDIETENAPGSGVTLTFLFYADEIPAGQSCDASEVYHWNGSAWEAMTRDSSYGSDGRMCGSEPYSIRVTGVTDFSPFVLKSDGVPSGEPAGEHTVYLPLVLR
ncbi:MAG: right-handed parallel beta-helix repeat-containing protein [Chloroflexi bacterium]|nr:right-handed parallel beta-helix repeat-containing protein [Chloroflexota bacterium]MBU1661796.1 right-handed parallel beta-helix repeat-containing protein [Chloroflexota bacterium]